MAPELSEAVKRRVLGMSVQMLSNKHPNVEKKLRQPSLSGFSLIELVFVIAIIFVITAVALPTVTTYLNSYRMNNDARSLMGEISLARMRAASSGGRAEVICDTSTTGSTRLTCGIAIRQLSDPAYHGYLPASIQIPGAVLDMPTQIRLAGTDSFGFPSGATSGAGLSSASTGTGAPGQYGSTPFNCNAAVFNSRGLTIFDPLANIATAGSANTCATLPVGSTDGQRRSNYVFYLQSGQSNYLAVVVDSTGNPSLWRWDSSGTKWRQFESGLDANGT